MGDLTKFPFFLAPQSRTLLWGCFCSTFQIFDIFAPPSPHPPGSSSALNFRVRKNYVAKVLSLVVQLLNCVLFATPWTAARQASLSFTNSPSMFKLMSIESLMPSNHLILCHLLLLLTSIFPSIRVSSNESALCIRWPK